MCYICSCFTWTLDLFQRILTFFISCWLACAVCIGLSVGVIAGIAYGYNYCLAEFIALTGSDVRVYMRRGQLYDKPDLPFKNSRRRGDEEDAYPTDKYQQEVSPVDDSITWERDQDTRKYAEKLTKYSDKYTKNSVVDTEQSVKEPKYYHPDGSSEDGVQNQASQKTVVDAGQQNTESNEYHKNTLLPARRVPIFLNPIVRTTILQSDSSQIVMRKFDPVAVPEPDEVDEFDDKSLKFFGKETHASVPLEQMERKTVAFTPDMRITLEDIERKTVAFIPDMRTTLEKMERKTVAFTPDMLLTLEDSSTRKLIKMQHWGMSSKPILEYSTEVDEDNLVYKAV